MLKSKGNIVVLKNNKFEVVEIDLQEDGTVGYESIKEHVGGWIEHFSFNKRLAKNGIECWCDDEGRLKNLPISIIVCDKQTKVIEVIAGDIVFCSSNGRGDSLPMNQRQIDVLLKELNMVAEIKTSETETARVRVMYWDCYEESEKPKEQKDKSIIEIYKIDSYKRECNVCGKNKNDMLEIKLGKNNSSICICMCEDCLNKFSEKIWEFLEGQN